MRKLTKKELTQIINQYSATNEDLQISLETMTLPFFYAETAKYEICVAAAYTHSTVIPNGKANTTFIYCTGEDQFVFDCGSNFLEKQNSLGAEIIEEIVQVLPETNQEIYRQEILDRMGSYTYTPESCVNKRLQINLHNFIENDFKGEGEIACKHIKNMFGNMDLNILEALEKAYKKLYKTMRKTSGNKIEDALESYGFKGESLLIVGPGGHGKTQKVKDYAQKKNYTFVEMHAHTQMEAFDIFGHEKKVGDSFIWLDGEVIQAARLAVKAKDDEKVMLFIDEFTNLPMSESANLKACFEPYKGHYYFKTGRIVNIEDGIGENEIIKVPIEKLQIVCAANMGAGYAYEELDKALKQRFLIIYFEMERKELKSILTSICKEKSFSEQTVQKLMNFQRAISEYVDRNELPDKPVLRHLSRKLLGLIDDEKDLEHIAFLQINQFVDFSIDGQPVEEQIEIVEEIIEKTLAA